MPLARIARIVTYVICPYERDSSVVSIADDVRQMIADSYLSVASIKSEEKDFQWSDDLIVNDVNATELDVAKFFRELPDV